MSVKYAPHPFEFKQRHQDLHGAERIIIEIVQFLSWPLALVTQANFFAGRHFGTESSHLFGFGTLHAEFIPCGK